ncbi:spidroin-1-like [Ananas comosus]|uniref:Spidroin-1-like n=1 Tax=Ananas comosus TaxID=4615 RepID=A0A6P5EUU4_ANACO|nr:spidroin-1-like [Ananas comosus]
MWRGLCWLCRDWGGEGACRESGVVLAAEGGRGEEEGDREGAWAGAGGYNKVQLRGCGLALRAGEGGYYFALVRGGGLQLGAGRGTDGSPREWGPARRGRGPLCQEMGHARGVAAENGFARDVGVCLCRDGSRRGKGVGRGLCGWVRRGGKRGGGSPEMIAMVRGCVGGWGAGRNGSMGGRGGGAGRGGPLQRMVSRWGAAGGGRAQDSRALGGGSGWRCSGATARKGHNGAPQVRWVRHGLICARAVRRPPVGGRALSKMGRAAGCCRDAVAGTPSCEAWCAESAPP